MGKTWRGFEITHNPKPIPTTAHDYDFVHAADYDGPGDPRCGTAASVEDAQRAISELIEDEELCWYCGAYVDADQRGLGLAHRACDKHEDEARINAEDRD